MSSATPDAKAGCCMNAPEHARNLLTMARKDAQAPLDRVGVTAQVERLLARVAALIA